MASGARRQQRPVVVVGGGFAGLSFALAAAGPHSPVRIVEARAPDLGAVGFDARSTALSWGSRRILESLDVWRGLGEAACPIHRIEVSDQGRYGGASFDRREQGREALGYVVENHLLGDALWRRVAASRHIDSLAPAEVTAAMPVADGMALRIRREGREQELTAALAVLADGGRSTVASRLGVAREQKSYEQHALIANVALAQSHRNTAFERFTEQGPLALLPLSSSNGVCRASLVWTMPATLARACQEMSEAELLPRLQAQFGPGMGRVDAIGERACYPLRLSRACELARPGLALLGNAAQTLHPVAGQGFNLALRDCMTLGRIVRGAAERGDWPGDMAVLQAYIDERESDQARTIWFTDLLVNLFSGANSAKADLRRLGLLAFDLIPPLRRQFVSTAMSEIWSAKPVGY